jgi:hypothetical protein
MSDQALNKTIELMQTVVLRAADILVGGYVTFRRKYCFHLQNTLKRKNGVISMKTALQFITALNTLNLLRD